MYAFIQFSGLIGVNLIKGAIRVCRMSIDDNVEYRFGQVGNREKIIEQSRYASAKGQLPRVDR